MRASALESIDKGGLICKSAECLLNDYRDIQPLDPRKKQRSFDLLDVKSETFELINSKQQNTNKGHSRSKSASLRKDKVVKRCKNQIKRDTSNSSTNVAEGELVLQIATTHYATDTTRTKPHTFPRRLNASKLEESLDLLTYPDSSILQHEPTKRRRKLDKISSMLSLVGSEKKEVIRYKLIFIQL